MLFDQTWHQVSHISDIPETNIFVNQLHIIFFFFTKWYQVLEELTQYIPTAGQLPQTPNTAHYFIRGAKYELFIKTYIFGCLTTV